MFRLIIDFPLGDDEEIARDKAVELLTSIRATTLIEQSTSLDILEKGQFRLTKDGDRGNKNYMNVDETGRILTGKRKLID